MNDLSQTARYQRQILLPEIGIKGQQLLHNAKVLVIGAGGLGCPALQYLVAAGVGTIGIVDGDTVDITNLHRQILYNTNDIGKSKALLAAEKLGELKNDCNIKACHSFLDSTNAFELIEAYDIILDGSDNFATRYLVNDVCVLLKKPLVYGAVYRFEGQVGVFNCLQNDGTYSAQYRDLFPVPPAQNTIPNCAEAGVLGVLPGIIGTMQANEVIKLITGIGKPLINTLLTYNALNNQTFQLAFTPTITGKNAVPESREMIEATNYNFECETDNDSKFISINAKEFDELLAKNNISIIDVREKNELPLIDLFEHLKMPLSTFNETAVDTDTDIVLFCQSGVRSKNAANRIVAAGKNDTKVYSLDGGITAWLAHKNEKV
ncbi:adenylyltransferase/sulfurtransferase MoeZ [soil metagenome]